MYILAFRLSWLVCAISGGLLGFVVFKERRWLASGNTALRICWRRKYTDISMQRTAQPTPGCALVYTLGHFVIVRIGSNLNIYIYTRTR